MTTPRAETDSHTPSPENLNLANTSDLISPTLEAATTPPASPTIVDSTSDVPVNALSPGLLELLGRGHRLRKLSILLKEYVVNTSRINTNPSLAPPISNHSSSDTIPGKTMYPVSSYISDASFSTCHRAFLAAITSAQEPKSYKEAILDDVWNDSMKDEYSALEIKKNVVHYHLTSRKKSSWE